jgi:hypothetical protein
VTNLPLKAGITRFQGFIILKNDLTPALFTSTLYPNRLLQEIAMNKTRAGASIFYFGFWVALCGVSLMFFPTLCLSMAGMHLNDVTVPRLFGMVLIFLSLYYFLAGRHPEFWPLYRLTVYTRSSAFIIVTVFALMGIVKPVVIGFVTVDALGALWTFLALKHDMKGGHCVPQQGGPA